MDIGARIKFYRRQNDMEQKDLANLLGVSNKTISSWETNRTEPKMEMIEKMCQIFNCRKSDFVDGFEFDYVFTHDEEIEMLIECYRKASYADRRLIDSILYKYSDGYIAQLEELGKAAKKIEEAENLHFDKNGNPIQKEED